MSDSWSPWNVDPGLMAAYSKPIFFSTSTMKSEAGRPCAATVRARSGGAALRLRVREVVRVRSVGSVTGGAAGGSDRLGGVFCRDDQTGGAERRAFEEIAAVERISHGALLVRAP